MEINESIAHIILNALSAHIAILDENGVILKTNRAWQNFADDNQMQHSAGGLPINYLSVCDLATGDNSQEAKPAAKGIRAVIKGEVDEFLLFFNDTATTETTEIFSDSPLMPGRNEQIPRMIRSICTPARSSRVDPSRTSFFRRVLLLRAPPTSPLFPYATLSQARRLGAATSALTRTTYSSNKRKKTEAMASPVWTPSVRSSAVIRVLERIQYMIEKTRPMTTAMMFCEFSAHRSKIHTAPAAWLSSGSGNHEMMRTSATP